LPQHLGPCPVWCKSVEDSETFEIVNLTHFQETMARITVVAALARRHSKDPTGIRHEQFPERKANRSLARRRTHFPPQPTLVSPPSLTVACVAAPHLGSTCKRCRAPTLILGFPTALSLDITCVERRRDIPWRHASSDRHTHTPTQAHVSLGWPTTLWERTSASIPLQTLHHMTLQNVFQSSAGKRKGHVSDHLNIGLSRSFCCQAV